MALDKKQNIQLKRPSDGVQGSDITNNSTVSGASVTDALNTLAAGSGTLLDTKGDLLTHDATVVEKLAVGTAGQVLMVNSAADKGIEWTTLPVPAARGDIWTYNATTKARALLPLGTNGFALFADSAQDLGIKWAAAHPLTAKGDIYVYNGTATARLAAGTDGQVLSADSSSAEGLKWIADSAGARGWGAVVAAAGGDYTTWGAAVAAGAKSIFIKNGTYIETASTTLSTAGVWTVGESRDGVILDFGASYGILATGGNAVFENLTIKTSAIYATVPNLIEFNSGGNVFKNVHFTGSGSSTANLLGDDGWTPVTAINQYFIDCKFTSIVAAQKVLLFLGTSGIVFERCEGIATVTPITNYLIQTTGKVIIDGMTLPNCGVGGVAISTFGGAQISHLDCSGTAELYSTSGASGLMIDDSNIAILYTLKGMFNNTYIGEVHFSGGAGVCYFDNCIIGDLGMSATSDGSIYTGCDIAAFTDHSGAEKVTFNGCHFTGAVDFLAPAHILNGNRFDSTVLFSSNFNTLNGGYADGAVAAVGNNNIINGMRVGLTAGGGTETITTSGDYNIVTSCQTDAALIDSGTGTVAANNIVF